ncbi:methyl-accepting chemotaxis protein, partial [Pantoea ananatis]
SIQENSAKRDVTVQMLDTLAKARLNRTLFQYTRDKKFIEINGEAMNQLFGLRTSLNKYSWSAEGGERLSVLSGILTQYQEKRQAFLESSDSAARALSEIHTLGLASLGEKLATGQASAPADIVAPLLSLSFRTEQAAFYVQEFIRKPDASTLDKFSEVRDAISPLVNQLRGVSGSALAAVVADVEQKMASGSAQLNNYLLSVRTEKQASDEMTAAAGKLNQSITDLAFFQSEMAEKYIRTALWQIGFATLACIVLSLLIAWRMTRSITVPLRETLSSAQRIAEGDLTSDITTSRTDELGELMTAVGAMNQSLRDIISRVRDGVNNV